MLIKHQDIHFRISSPLPAVVVLIGQDAFLIETIATAFKKAWQAEHQQQSDNKRLTLETAADWGMLLDEVNHYSLFSNTTLIEAHYAKKSLDSEGKAFFESYLNRINPDCLLIIRAPELTQKPLQFLVNAQQAVLVQTKAPDRATVLRWIKDQLTALKIHYQPAIIPLIEQYTRGNLSACAQLLEKIGLTHDPNQALSIEQVKRHLVDQSEYQLFELSDACLLGQADQALLILRSAIENRGELTLILWILAQDVRLLLQLLDSAQHNRPFATTLSQLKIWPQRGKLYQAALKRHNQAGLSRLLACCGQLDTLIKTSQTPQIKRNFELLVLGLSLGYEVVHVE